MKISVDTNILARAVLQDDPGQSHAAARLLQDATLIAISLPCLCELVWVLRRGAQLPVEAIAAALNSLLNADNVVMNRPAVEAGLEVLEAGGDFADGVMAYDGKCLGGEIFASFDTKAIKLLQQHGHQTILPA